MPLRTPSRARSFGLESLENRTFLSAAMAPEPLTEPTFRIHQHQDLTPSATSGATGVTPAQMRHAYGVDAINLGGIVGDGAGQTIAIVDAYDYPTAASDLHVFDLAFGLPDPPSFLKLNQDGGTSFPSPAPSGGWGVEAALDIQWAHVMAPKANIILYEGNSASFSDLVVHAVNTARNNPNVTVVSMSFGAAEFSTETSYDSYFTTPAGHSGVTFLASTGDTGSPGSYPAYSPNIVAVGGTSLSNDSSGNYLSESGWSGSGGGNSSYEAEPSFQSSVQSTGKRSTPDVSLDADPNTGVPVYDTYDNGTSTPWTQVGGTSLAAPLWAGLAAIADQGRVGNGLSTLDGRSGMLPALYQSASTNFHDITSGSNGGFSASVGYDRVTGRGTPISNLLIPSLVGTPSQTPIVQSLTASPNPVAIGGNVNLTANGVSDPNGYVVSVSFYRESNGIAGLQVGSDSLVGSDTDGSNGWSKLSTAPTKQGSFAYYAQALDNSGTKSNVASATVSVKRNGGSAPLTSAALSVIETGLGDSGTASRSHLIDLLFSDSLISG